MYRNAIRVIIAFIFGSFLATGIHAHMVPELEPVAPITIEEAYASFFDASMTRNGNYIQISGYRSNYGYVKITYYNGGWGWLGTASDGDGIVRVSRYCPSSATKAYWVVVSAPGYTSQEFLFYRDCSIS